ncbi:MAG: class I SAM-dependent methyltransferase [Chloroflexota bacterium]
MAKQNSIWVSTDLIFANVNFEATERVLIMTGDGVDLIEGVAANTAEVAVYEPQFSTLERLRRYVRVDNVTFHDDVYPADEDAYDAAIVFVPKGREFGRAQLYSAMKALKMGGALYLVGPNKGGAKTLIKDAQALFGSCEVMAYKKSHRLAVSIKNAENYPYPTEWGLEPTKMRYIEIETPLGTLEIASMPGIFSWDELDKGTSFLLENLDLGEAETALDVGCGYGVIGALLAQKLQHVTLVDDNLLAVACTKATLAKNGIENASVLPSNVYSALDKTEPYDLIVSNPPFHRGLDVSRNVVERIIRDAPDYLRAEGRLVLVANEFLSYETNLAEAFTQSGSLARNNSFKVLEGLV